MKTFAIVLPASILAAALAAGCADTGPSCAADQLNCNGVCLSVKIDPGNCGGCGIACGTGKVCNQGTCGDCVNGQTDNCSNACGAGTRTCAAGRWSNCSAPAPGTETCDGADNDCDGQIDEGVTTKFYRDGDADTHGDPLNSTDACTAPAGFVTTMDDCNDADPGVHPGMAESCATPKDDNCNGTPNEGCGCTPSTTQPCGDWGDKGKCEFGSQTCQAGGTWGECTGGVKPAAETCNVLDDDCDDQTDEGLAVDLYEANNECTTVRALPPAPEGGVDDEALELADATLYKGDGTNEVDWYSILTDEGWHACVPFTNQCCFNFDIAFKTPEGANHSDYKMCIFAGGDVCTAPELTACTDETYWNATSGAYEMTACWHGTCGFEDGKTFYVKIENNTGGKGSCKPYKLTYKFYMTGDECPTE